MAFHIRAPAGSVRPAGFGDNTYPHPLALRNTPGIGILSPKPRYSCSSMYSADETRYSPPLSTLSSFTTPLSTIIE
jgi:hypothetical protein